MPASVATTEPSMVHGSQSAAHTRRREERPHSSCERARRRCASGGNGCARRWRVCTVAKSRRVRPQPAEAAMTLADYFRSLPLIARERHFNDPWVCQALLRSLTPLARLYVLRLASVGAAGPGAQWWTHRGRSRGGGAREAPRTHSPSGRTPVRMPRAVVLIASRRTAAEACVDSRSNERRGDRPRRRRRRWRTAARPREGACTGRRAPACASSVFTPTRSASAAQSTAAAASAGESRTNRAHLTSARSHAPDPPNAYDDTTPRDVEVRVVGGCGRGTKLPVDELRGASSRGGVGEVDELEEREELPGRP